MPRDITRSDLDLQQLKDKVFSTDSSLNVLGRRLKVEGSPPNLGAGTPKLNLNPPPRRKKRAGKNGYKSQLSRIRRLLG